jgi:hypothetical protein
VRTTSFSSSNERVLTRFMYRFPGEYRGRECAIYKARPFDLSAVPAQRRSNLPRLGRSTEWLARDANVRSRGLHNHEGTYCLLLAAAAINSQRSVAQTQLGQARSQTLATAEQPSNHVLNHLISSFHRHVGWIHYERETT